MWSVQDIFMAYAELIVWGISQIQHDEGQAWVLTFLLHVEAGGMTSKDSCARLACGNSGFIPQHCWVCPHFSPPPKKKRTSFLRARFSLWGIEKSSIGRCKNLLPSGTHYEFTLSYKKEMWGSLARKREAVFTWFSLCLLLPPAQPANKNHSIFVVSNTPSLSRELRVGVAMVFCRCHCVCPAQLELAACWGMLGASALRLVLAVSRRPFILMWIPHFPTSTPTIPRHLGNCSREDWLSLTPIFIHVLPSLALDTKSLLKVAK